MKNITELNQSQSKEMKLTDDQTEQVKAALQLIVESLLSKKYMLGEV